MLLLLRLEEIEEGQAAEEKGQFLDSSDSSSRTAGKCWCVRFSFLPSVLSKALHGTRQTHSLTHPLSNSLTQVLDAGECLKSQRRLLEAYRIESPRSSDLIGISS